MRLTTFFMALLLCAHSFKVDAGVGKGTWLRNALRATTAQVNGMSSKIKASVGIPLVIFAACASFYSCDRVDLPDYANSVIGVDNESFAELGISMADAERYSDPNMLMPADYDGMFVAFMQDGIIETGTAMDIGRSNELEITNLENMNGRRTIIKKWQIKGVLINDSDNAGNIMYVNSSDIKRKATTVFKEERAARQLLWHKDVTIFGEVVNEFSDGWLLFIPVMGTGFGPNENIFFDLGIRGFWDQPIYLFVQENKVTWAETDE